jgi:hypothetical protein
MKGAKDLHGLLKDFLKLKVDGTGGAVIIDIGIKIETCVEKHGQRIEPPLIQDQPFPMIRYVMEEPSPVDGSDRDSGHIGIA